MIVSCRLALAKKLSIMNFTWGRWGCGIKGADFLQKSAAAFDTRRNLSVVAFGAYARRALQ